jgi:hypothetical protein
MQFRRQIVCASGEPRARVGQGWAKWLVAFWLPVPHGRRVPRNLQTHPSAVTDAQPFEIQALADGALLEVTAVMQFPLTMPMAARREIVDREWRSQCERRFGGAPEVPKANGLIVTPELAQPAP